MGSSAPCLPDTWLNAGITSAFPLISGRSKKPAHRRHLSVGLSGGMEAPDANPGSGPPSRNVAQGCSGWRTESLSDTPHPLDCIDAFHPSRIGKKLAEESGRKLVGRRSCQAPSFGNSKSKAPCLHAMLHCVYLFVITGQRTNEQARRILRDCNGLAHVFACQVQDSQLALYSATDSIRR